MAAGEQRQAKRDAEDGGEHQPSHAARVHFPPVLHHHDERDGDGDEDGQRGGYFERDAQRQQRNGEQRLAKPDGRANERRDENDGENVNRRRLKKPLWKTEGRMREVMHRFRQALYASPRYYERAAIDTVDNVKGSDFPRTTDGRIV